MEKQLDLFERVNKAESEIPNKETDSNTDIPNKYIIPKTTESPSKTGGLAKAWIIRFHKMNDMPLPQGFHGRKARGYIGMYKGMLETYNINEFRDVLPQRPEKRY